MCEQIIYYSQDIHAIKMQLQDSLTTRFLPGLPNLEQRFLSVQLGYTKRKDTAIWQDHVTFIVINYNHDR